MTGRIYDGRPVQDTPSNRLLGWQRICLLVSFFGPSNLYDPRASFDAYAGRPFVFPVVRNPSHRAASMHPRAPSARVRALIATNTEA